MAFYRGVKIACQLVWREEFSIHCLIFYIPLGLRYCFRSKRSSTFRTRNRYPILHTAHSYVQRGKVLSQTNSTLKFNTRCSRVNQSIFNFFKLNLTQERFEKLKMKWNIYSQLQSISVEGTLPRLNSFLLCWTIFCWSYGHLLNFKSDK